MVRPDTAQAGLRARGTRSADGRWFHQLGLGGALAPRRSVGCWPGSRGALLLPSPLRTARKPFGLCRSSLSQGPSRSPVGPKGSTCTILVWGWPAEPAGDRTSSKLPSDRLCLPSQLVRRSRAETPEGSQPAFAGVISPEDSTPIRPITGRHSLPPSSSTRRPIGDRLAAGLPREGGRRAYHVPRMNHGWFRLCLSAGGSDSDGRGRENPCTWPLTFWFKPISAFGLSGSHDVYQQFTWVSHAIHPGPRPPWR